MTDPNANPRDRDVLSSHLVDKELDAVTFVRDYMQFVFHGATLTVYVSPSVATAEQVLTEGMSGYADALRGLIGMTVLAATQRDEQELELTFADGFVVRISPDPSLPEVAMLQVGDGSTWAVW